MQLAPQHHVGGDTLVALGSNATSTSGAPRGTVLAALDTLRTVFGAVRASHLYASPAFPAGSGPDFVNAACVIRTALSVDDTLAELHRIEASFGRTRTRRWGARTLDLDLIARDQIIAPDAKTQTHWRTLPPDAQSRDAPDRLILPHPRVQDRAFVLRPLCDVAPDWVHPILGRTAADLLARLPAADRAAITLL